MRLSSAVMDKTSEHRAFRSHQIDCFGWHPVGIFAIPLDIAADWIGERRTHRFAGDMFLQSILKIIDRDFGSIERTVYPASRVYQFSVLVEDVEMWCSQSSIRQRYFLRFVAQV